MALSMDEQRMLAEIEARLSAEDPRLAVRLSSFRRATPAAKLRSPRNRILGSLFAVALAVVISLMVYAMIPFRAHSPGRGSASPLASGSAAASAPAKPAPKAATSAVTAKGAAGSGGAATAGSASPRAGASAVTATTATAAKAGGGTATAARSS